MPHSATPTSPDQHNGPAGATPSKRELYQRLDQVSLADARKLRRRLAKARSKQAFTAIAADIDAARVALAARASIIPQVTYPATLPVSARKDDIAQAIENHQVVIVAGETGSGKTTRN